MKPVMKKISQLALLVVVATGFTGCDEKDVVNGIIIGGIIGGIAAGSDLTVGTPRPSYSFLSDCEGYRREWVCDWSSGGWRRTHRRPVYAPTYPTYPPHHPRPVHPRPDRPRRHFSADLTAANAATVVTDLKALQIEDRWKLKPQAASKLSNVIENAKGGDMKAFTAIGLNLRDLNTLLNKKQVSADNLANVSKQLQTTEDNALAILNDFVREYKLQQQDVGSAMWNQCTASGQWKTPEAASCSSLADTGCAPTTGASSCLPM